MKPIIINDKNTEKINAVLASANGKARERTASYKDVVRAVEAVEDRLDIYKKDMEGVIVSCDIFAEILPKAYKYQAYSTQFVIERTKTAWVLKDVDRWKMDQTKGIKYTVIKMPEATQAAIIKKHMAF